MNYFETCFLDIFFQKLQTYFSLCCLRLRCVLRFTVQDCKVILSHCSIASILLLLSAVLQKPSLHIRNSCSRLVSLCSDVQDFSGSLRRLGRNIIFNPLCTGNIVTVTLYCNTFNDLYYSLYSQCISYFFNVYVKISNTKFNFFKKTLKKCFLCICSGQYIEYNYCHVKKLDSTN